MSRVGLRLCRVRSCGRECYGDWFRGMQIENVCMLIPMVVGNYLSLIMPSSSIIYHRISMANIARPRHDLERHGRQMSGPNSCAAGSIIVTRQRYA
jgi:hypothetical protein